MIITAKQYIIKGLLAAGLFFAVLYGALMLCIYLDNSTLYLSDGSALPESTDGQLYAVDYKTVDSKHVSFSFTGASADPTELVVAYGRPFRLEFDGECVYSFDEQSVYLRLHEIPLPVEDTASAQKHTVDFYSDTMPASSERLKLAIGDPEVISDKISGASSAYYFIYGVCGMILIACLVLALVKSSEAQYLCALSFYAVITALTIFFALNDTDMKITLAVCQPFQVYITTLSYISGVMACVLLPMQCMHTPSGRLRRNYISYILIPCIIYSAFLILLAVFGQSDKLRYLYRFYYFMGLPSLCIACAMRGKGSFAMLVTYALIRALGDFSNHASTLSTCTLFVRLSIVDTLPFVLACMIVIFWWFGAKFCESDRLNTELAEIRASLDRRVAECTAELETDNQRLIDAEKRRHAMMTNIFHDIRNPIFALKGCIDMMTSQSENDKRLIAICQNRLAQLKELTENLFLISKLEDKEVMFSPSVQDIGKLCESVTSAFSVEAQKKSIKLVYTPQENCLVSGDLFWLRRMLENLVDNAIKYTPENGTVSLRLLRADSTVTIEIEDTGKGIAPDDLKNIFDRYFHGRLEDKNTSSGLGLSIAKEIVTAHDGEIGVRSEVGHGTVFSVSLPSFDPLKEQAEEY